MRERQTRPKIQRVGRNCCENMFSDEINVTSPIRFRKLLETSLSSFHDYIHASCDFSKLEQRIAGALQNWHGLPVHVARIHDEAN